MSEALEGLKVLDLSMNLPGPYMTWLLATLGADVVKIENPQGGDYARFLPGGTNTESSPFFHAVNRNKKSVSLNLKHPEGKRIFLSLLDSYDVLVEGFRPGTMERLGLGFDTTSQHQPRLIHVSISGYGQESPYRSRAGHDLNYLSLAGVISITGTPDGELAIPGIQVADLAGGSLLGLSGLLAAVLQRERTGEGQYVDVAMFDGALSMATMILAGIEAGLEKPEPGQMLLNGKMPCYGLYRTKDGRFMSLGALEAKFWQNFCEAVDRKDLLGVQFGGPDTVAEVRKIFAERTQEEWVQLMKDHDACCEPVIPLGDAVDSPLARERQMVSILGDGRKYLASPIRLSRSPALAENPAPMLGEHTKDILSQVGLSAEEIDELKSQGVI